MSIAFSVSLAFILLLCGMIVVLLRFVHQGPRQPGLLLSAFCAIWFLILLHILLLSTGWILDVPHAFRLTAPVEYLIGPAAYLYVRAVLRREDHFLWRDLWHALPFFIHTLELLPFYLETGHDKVVYLTEKLADRN